MQDWVTDDLPADTNSRDLDNTNAQAVLRANGVDEKDCQVKVTQEIVGAYLAFMAEISFIGWPNEKENGGAKEERLSSRIMISEDQKRALKMVGRGGGG